jgi:hypothetical protein
VFWLFILLGMLMAYRRESALDHVLSFIASLFHSVPSYISGILLVLVLGIQLNLIDVAAMRGMLAHFRRLLGRERPAEAFGELQRRHSLGLLFDLFLQAAGLLGRQPFPFGGRLNRRGDFGALSFHVHVVAIIEIDRQGRDPNDDPRGQNQLAICGIGHRRDSRSQATSRENVKLPLQTDPSRQTDADTV